MVQTLLLGQYKMYLLYYGSLSVRLGQSVAFGSDPNALVKIADTGSNPGPAPPTGFLFYLGPIHDK